MMCEEIQKKISSFIDGEIVEDIDRAFSHVYSCVDCQEFLSVSLKFKIMASKDVIKFPRVEVVKKKTLKARLREVFKVEVPIPVPLLSAVVFMLFLLSFLLAIFVYDKAMTTEIKQVQVPAYGETRTVIVYGIPQVTVYPKTEK